MNTREKEDLALFKRLINENRYNFLKLAYIIFPFGEKGGPLEDFDLYDWQKEELVKISNHLSNPATRYETYRLIVSSGNGAAKTALGAVIMMCLMYTQRLKARITANTMHQLNQNVWSEYDLWFNRARYVNLFFDKFGTSIKAKDPAVADTWKIDTFTWSEQNPAAVSGLHNKGAAVAYLFEEAPGIPAIIWQYASGAFTETGTIKLHIAFGNSDDPESKFEQNMTSPDWNARRIDTRELKHIDPKQIEVWLREAGGDEDDDDFRVRVRGLPRKSARDSIIKIEAVQNAIARRKTFDHTSIAHFPVIIACDPAWTGGDETVISYKQGPYICLLERFKLNKKDRDTHVITYKKLCYWERQLRADAVHIDQAEGTGIYTLAQMAEKNHWLLVHFNMNPTDHPDASKSEFKNIRSMMYYKTQMALMSGYVLDSKDESWIEDMSKQLCWAKGTRHKVTNQKLVEPKQDIKDRVGKSPDIADAIVLLFAYEVVEKLPENEHDEEGEHFLGGQPMKMKELDLEDLYG